MRINRINKRKIRIIIMLIVCVTTFVVGTVVSNASAYPGVEYRACLENSGWLDWVRNKETSGDITKGEKLRVIKMILTDTNEGGIAYTTYAMGEGWQEKATNGDATGSISGIQGIKVALFGDISTKYSVKYRVHMLNGDWTEWVKDAAVAGVTSGNSVIDGYEAVLIGKDGNEVITEAVDYSKDLPVTDNTQQSESKSTEVTNVENIVVNNDQQVTNTEQQTQGTEESNNQQGTNVEQQTQVTEESNNQQGTNVEQQTQVTEEKVPASEQPAQTNELAKKLVETASKEIGQKQDETGWTKYGQWWADKVGDQAFAKAKWSSMFLAWCGNQIGLEDEKYGYYACSDYWVTWFKNNNAYHEVKDYTPLEGDMIFFDYDQDGKSDHNGLVKGINGTKVVCIEGNVDGEVKECEYEMSDAQLKGYGTPLFDKVIEKSNEVKTGGGTTNDYAKSDSPITGIDVSEFNGTIDWNQVKAAGIKFAYIRVGYRGWGYGTLVLDKQFYNNIQNASAAGIDIGFYFYTQAINTDEAIEEANYVLDKIQGYNVKYPIVIDTEQADPAERSGGLSKESRTAIMKAFCNRVSEAGYKGQIYASKCWFTERLNINDIMNDDKWVAEYTHDANGRTSFAYPYSVWQYTSSGSVAGINGNVDMNNCYVNY